MADIDNSYVTDGIHYITEKVSWIVLGPPEFGDDSGKRHSHSLYELSPLSWFEVSWLVQRSGTNHLAECNVCMNHYLGWKEALSCLRNIPSSL
jgi:hypothetical protein